MDFSIQPILENDKVVLYPLLEEDFEALYTVASDPAVWEQHPNRDRWKKDVFQNFFEGAMQSKGAFRIVDKATGEVIGSTRYYNYNADDNSIQIGYTFYGTRSWGKGFNPSVKAMMLDYIFQFVDRVYFHIGAQNIRSQIAISRLGARKVAEEDIAYFGEPAKPNFVYEIWKEDWLGAGKSD
jgi:RimJ/RimL family protein N-acetyltransferase